MEGKTGGVPDVSNMIQAIADNEKAVKAENNRLKQIYAIQESVMEKQRQLLKEVAKTSAELLEVERKRAELKEKLASQKTSLLTASAEAQEVSSIIEEILVNAPPPLEMSKTPSGNLALKVIETVGQNISEITNMCINSQNLSVPADHLNQAVVTLNELIQKLVDANVAIESPEDTINRQSFVISSLVRATQEE